MRIRSSVGASWSEWIYKGLAILLIDCPCALVISMPAALSAGVRRGLLTKGGVVLETLGKITSIAFDKTGTLTAGRLVVTDLIGVGRPERDVRSLAAALEKGSSHPLALVILDRAKSDKAPVPPAFDAQAVAGEGVEGTAGENRSFSGLPAPRNGAFHFGPSTRAASPRSMPKARRCRFCFHAAQSLASSRCATRRDRTRCKPWRS